MNLDTRRDHNGSAGRVAAMPYAITAALCFMLLASAAPLWAQPGTPREVIINPRGSAGSAAALGQSVASFGSNVLAGAPGDSTGQTGSGLVYLFDGSDGSTLLTIRNPAPGFGDAFGTSIAQFGANILAAAPDDDPANVVNSGTVYLFNGALRGSLNAPILTISNPTPQIDDRFGFALAVQGDVIIVGAYGDRTGANRAGSVYLFDGNARGALNIPLLTINNPAPNDSDFFGYSVAPIGSNRIAIGAFLDDVGANNTGAVYVFDSTLRGTTSTPILTITNPSPTDSDFFGSALAVVGNRVVVGAPNDDTGAADTGSVYVFDGLAGGTTSTPVMTIRNPNTSGAEGDQFGSAIGVSGTDIIVGMQFKNTPGDPVVEDTGVVYLFDGTASGTVTSALLTINNPSPAESDGFGQAVAGHGSLLLVGGPGDDTAAADAGVAYIFEGLRPVLTPTAIPSVTPGPSPTPTIPPTPTAQATPTIQATPTRSPTPPPTQTPSPSPSPTVTPTQTPSPTMTRSPAPTSTPPPPERGVGDFDASGCTDVGDFLFLLDNWMLPTVSPPLGVQDFLNLVDNYKFGSNCP